MPRPHTTTLALLTALAGLLSEACEPLAPATPPRASAHAPGDHLHATHAPDHHPHATPAPASTTNPLAELTPTHDHLSGRILEAIPAGGYTYLRLAPHDTWAVVLGPAPPPGHHIRARVFARKAAFRSHRLDRTFTELNFVTLDG